MPLPIHLAHRLVERQAQLRRAGKLNFLRPDAKSQVTVRYVDGKPKEIDTVVLSTQHHPDIEHETLSEAVIEEIIKPVLPPELVAITSSIWSTRPDDLSLAAPRRLRTHGAQDHRRHIRVFLGTHRSGGESERCSRHECHG